MRTRRHVGASIGLALATIAVLAAPPLAASAAPKARQDKDGSLTVLDPCIKLAATEKATQWVCDSSGLWILGADATGQVTSVRHAEVTPRIAAAAESGNDYVSTTPLTVTDDYDYWCEGGSICSRNISAFISETKGNAAYGNQDGVIGSFDVIIRTTLNGARRPSYKVTLIWDLGPTLTFTELYVDCYEAIPLWPDLSCGVFSAASGGVYPTITPTSWRWNSTTIVGNNLVNAHPYYAATNGRFVASGHSEIFLMSSLETNRFNCPSVAVAL